MKTVQQEWQGYAKAVIPNLKAGSIQYDEMQKAFYAGTFSMIMNLLEIAELSDEQGVIELEKYRQECERFNNQIRSQIKW